MPRLARSVLAVAVGLQGVRGTLRSTLRRKRYRPELHVSALALDKFVGTWRKQIQRIELIDRELWLSKRLFETDPDVTAHATQIAELNSDGEIFSDSAYEAAIIDAWKRSFDPKRKSLTCFQVWRLRAHCRAQLMLEGDIL